MFRKMLNIIQNFFFTGDLEEASITVYIPLTPQATVHDEWLAVSCNYVQRLMYYY